MVEHNTNKSVSDSEKVADICEKRVTTPPDHERSPSADGDDIIYPPKGQVILIMLSLSAAMFLVALVSSFFPCIYENLMPLG